MSHIDEGLLHAHLDGALGPGERERWREAEAHLEACAECRRRLEEAEELRRAASDVLAGARVPAPAPEARPGFAVLAAEADRRKRAGDPDGEHEGRRAGHPAGGAWWRSTARLAWAASLVVAVGAGWIGRQLVVEQGSEAVPVMTEDADAALHAEDEARDGAVRAPAEPAPEPDAGAPARDDVPAAREREVDEVGRREAAEAAVNETAEPGAGGEAIGLQALALDQPETARCYVAGDERDEAVVDGARTDEPDAPGAAAIRSLRLEPGGTATARAGGEILVGYWESDEDAESDAVRLRLSAGEDWQLIDLGETTEGFVADGPANVTLAPANCPPSGAPDDLN